MDASSVNQHNWMTWLEDQCKKYGNTLIINKLPPKSYEAINPIEELLELQKKGGKTDSIFVLAIDDEKKTKLQ